MEKRFTFKDFLVFTSFTILAVLILLGMYMVDRQWLVMSEMKDILQGQSKDIRQLNSQLAALKRQIGEGRQVAFLQDSNSDKVTDEAADAFARAKIAAKQPDYATGDWFVRAFGVSVKTITPFISQDAYASRVQEYVLETLLQRNPDTLEWQGLIAQSWEVSEDGSVYRFKLRDDVFFSDGEPLTAEDVAFTFNFIMDDKIAAPRLRAYYNKIAKVEAESQQQVVFYFKEPYFNSLALAGSLEILPKHFYADYLDKPETYNQSRGLLLGSGPYRLKNPKTWSSDLGFIELVRNTRYWGDVEPSFDGLLWKIIENDSARLTTFRNGEIDVYGAQPSEFLPLKQEPDIKETANTFEYMSPTAGYSYIGWNQERKGKPTLFADTKVRQAMTYLTDREKIIKEIMQGYAEVAVSPFSPRSKQHTPALEPRPFNLNKAKALLKEAGFELRDQSGILKNSAGEPFEFELVYFQDSDNTKKIVLFLKDAYARAGIRLIPKPTEWSVMMELMDQRDFDAITLGWTSGIEIDVFQMLHSSQTADKGDNFVNFKNTEFDDLIERARHTVIESERMPLWQAAEKVLYREQPYTFLMRGKSLGFIDKRIKNVQQTNIGLNIGITPLEIYVPLAEQKRTN